MGVTKPLVALGFAASLVEEFLVRKAFPETKIIDRNVLGLVLCLVQKPSLFKITVTNHTLLLFGLTAQRYYLFLRSPQNTFGRLHVFNLLEVSKTEVS